jgi:hypothetical protein
MSRGDRVDEECSERETFLTSQNPFRHGKMMVDYKDVFSSGWRLLQNAESPFTGFIASSVAHVSANFERLIS